MSILRKKMANGGQPPIKKPIIVSNPNDSRLKRYSDSLSAYNYSQQGVKDLMSIPSESEVKNYIDRDTKRYPAEAIGRLSKYNGNYLEPGYTATRVFPMEEVELPMFNHPEQSYIYRKPELKRSIVQNVIPTKE